MATIEEVIVARMNGYAGLASLIGSGAATRLFWPAVPQGASLPAVTYQIIDSPQTKSQQGSSHLARTRVQFLCHADSLPTARTLGKQVEACWDGVRGTLSGLRIDGSFVDTVRPTFSSEHYTPVVMIDVIIWHEEQ